MKTLLVLLLASVTAHAEISWVTLKLMHAYKDIDVNCKGMKDGSKLYLSFEHDGKTVSRAIISNFPYVWPYVPIYKKTELSPKERASIELFRDSKGRYWIWGVALSEATVGFVLREGAAIDNYCRLPQPLLTVLPNPAYIQFEVEGLKEGIWISEAQWRDLWGTRSDGKEFQARMRFQQREYRP